MENVLQYLQSHSPFPVQSNRQQQQQSPPQQPLLLFRSFSFSVVTHIGSLVIARHIAKPVRTTQSKSNHFKGNGMERGRLLHLPIERPGSFHFMHVTRQKHIHTVFIQHRQHIILNNNHSTTQSINHKPVLSPESTSSLRLLCHTRLHSHNPSTHPHIEQADAQSPQSTV